MADTAKKRKRTKTTFYDDSDDDDFSASTPPPQESVKPATKLKKKKKTTEKTAVYTSTQDPEVAVVTPGRKERLSIEERRFQQELQEALRLSADETGSSYEIIPGAGEFNPSLVELPGVGELNPSLDEVPSVPEHGLSSADTVNVDDLISSSAEDEGVREGTVVEGGNEGSLETGELTEKEVIVIDEDDSNPSQKIKEQKEKIGNFVQGLKEEKTGNLKPDLKVGKAKSPRPPRKLPVKDEEDDFAAEPAPNPGKNPGKLAAKKKRVVDAWIVNTPTSDTKLTVSRREKLETPSAETKVTGPRKYILATPTLDSKKVSRREQVIEKTAGATKIVNNKNAEVNCDEDQNDEDPPGEALDLEDSPVKKRKRRSKVIDSDSDCDEEVEPTRKEKEEEEENDENSVENIEEAESEDEYVPQSKKKKSAEKKKKEKPGSKEKTTKKEKCGKSPESKPLSNYCTNVPETLDKPDKQPVVDKPVFPEKPARLSRIEKPAKVEYTKISSPLVTKPVVESPKPGTPGQGRGLGVGAVAGQVKIPVWTPPARVGLAKQSPASTSSPIIGLRVGLSRNMRVSKPLHSTVKKTD